jgi:hypothetical protein
MTLVDLLAEATDEALIADLATHAAPERPVLMAA